MIGGFKILAVAEGGEGLQGLTRGGTSFRATA